MNIEEYMKRYREIEKETQMPYKVTDDELAKMYVSHVVVLEWQVKQQEEAYKREEEKARRRKHFKESLWKAEKI